MGRLDGRVAIVTTALDAFGRVDIVGELVDRRTLDGHPDQPEWLSHVNASVLKVKLATAIIGISSIHLLKTFINADNYNEKTLMWQTLIHLAFLASAMAIAATDRILSGPAKH